MTFKPEMILILAIVILYSGAVTAVSKCITNPTGTVSVDIDVVSVPGPEGPNGDQGPRGYPGDTSQCGKNREVKQTEQISSELNDLIKSTFTKCGIYNLNWRRVTYIDTTQGAACPNDLCEVNSSAFNKKACGRTVDVGCSSLNYTSEGSYTQVCGRARGYQFGSTDGFQRHGGGTTINDTYVDGLSITTGSPRKHIWSYVAGHHETDDDIQPSQCPCAGSEIASKHKPHFVGDDYYCESGFISYPPSTIAWEDPLWDGEGCTQPNNTCCKDYGWFHKEVNLTSDDIEVRWCGDESRATEDVYTDIVEIWVL